MRSLETALDAAGGPTDEARRHALTCLRRQALRAASERRGLGVAFSPSWPVSCREGRRPCGLCREPWRRPWSRRVPPAIRPAIRSKRRLVSRTIRIVNSSVVRFVISAQPTLKLIGNHGGVFLARRARKSSQSPRVLVQARKTSPMIEMATNDTTGHAISQRAIVQLIALVAVGRESEQRTPIAAMNAPIVRFPTTQVIYEFTVTAPTTRRQGPGQQHGGGQPAQGIEAADELGEADLAGVSGLIKRASQVRALALRGDRDRRSQADAPLEQPAEQSSRETAQDATESIERAQDAIARFGWKDRRIDDHRRQDEAAPADARS